MNKVALAVVVVIAVAAILLLVNGSQRTDDPAGNSASTNSSSTSNSQLPALTPGGSTLPTGSEGGDDSQGIVDVQDRPATEIYKSAEEALNAVKQGAPNYDDVILEQFTELGPDCSWCDGFYKSVKDLMAAADTPNDQKSYYAELLAISGRVDNVKSLVDAIESAAQGQDSQVAMEALEMTVGKDDVVNFLGEKLNSTQNSTLKESIVAAISNQGSPLAINTLYRATIESGNPDGYYSEGTGLGEVIPDEESYPLLRDMIQKKDDYSHLAVKAILNSGLDGLKALYDGLNSSSNVDQDRKILKDAIDHINYDDETEKYLKEVMQKSSNPALSELANSALESFAQEPAGGEDEGEEVFEEAPAQPGPPAQ
jgi:hypothetical protein